MFKTEPTPDPVQLPIINVKKHKTESMRNDKVPSRIANPAATKRKNFSEREIKVLVVEVEA